MPWIDLSPYREEDRTEALELMNKSEGGLKNLNLAYFKDGDLEKDGVWDVWRIEGPKSVIHFRGAPTFMLLFISLLSLIAHGLDS